MSGNGKAYQRSMSVSDGDNICPELRQLLNEKGWKRPIRIYSITVVSGLEDFPFDWHQEMFNKLAVDSRSKGRFVLERAEWKKASPAFRYYIQVGD